MPIRVDQSEISMSISVSTPGHGLCFHEKVPDDSNWHICPDCGRDVKRTPQGLSTMHSCQWPGCERTKLDENGVTFVTWKRVAEKFPDVSTGFATHGPIVGLCKEHAEQVRSKQ